MTLMQLTAAYTDVYSIEHIRAVVQTAFGTRAVAQEQHLQIMLQFSSNLNWHAVVATWTFSADNYW
jgi:hypothetical protein